ncbi:MAG: YcaO-like family protein [Deltaproteobacteria bacterium]|nr:YcaO-like family protein [Deltaproteobacteria bacterium]
MQLQNHIRNKFGKCALPGNTIQRIKQGLQPLGLQAEYSPFQVSDNLYWGQVWIDSIKIICEGKGITPQLAEASAYAELTERLSAGMFYPVFEEQVRFNIPALYGQETTRFLNFEWMKGYANAHQNELENSLRIEDLLINEHYLSKEDIEDIKNSDMCRHWVDGFSLIKQRDIKVPVKFIAYVHGSNGMAAGNTLEEAMIQAACEVFERYAQIHTIKPEIEVPTIDKRSVGNSLIQELIQFYQNQSINVLIKDLSFGEIFPVLGVLYTNKNLRADRLEHRILIPGASFNPDEALTRCFTEGAQGRTTLKKPRPKLDKPVVHKSIVDNYYMLMRCGVSLKDISFLERGEIRPYKEKKCKDLYSEINEIKKICLRLDTDIFILDHTHPVLDFPVVRIIIPGISDFLSFLKNDTLVSKNTKPSSALGGEEYIDIMKSFFPECGI